MESNTKSQGNKPEKPESAKRRDFLILTAGAIGGVGAVGLVWPFISSMNPAADVLSASKLEVDLSHVKEGQSITVMWRQKPVFIRHNTEKEIEEARAVKVSDLRDPETVEQRCPYSPKWIIQIGICTHLGCIPLGQKPGQPRGDYGGWFCPCHGSQYDTVGRIRSGPAPLNLWLLPYKFVNEHHVILGEKA